MPAPTIGLTRHELPDADAAVRWLVEALAALAPGPFDRPVVLVHHPALQRHLTLGLATATGCAASVRFVSPMAWVDEVTGLEGAEREWRATRMAWTIAEVLEGGEVEFPAGARTTSIADPLGRMEFAHTVARRFRLYLQHRPDLLLHWESEDATPITADRENESWQRALWRAVVQRSASRSPAQIVADARAGRLPLAAPAPDTILIVGAERLPPTVRLMLETLALSRAVRWGVLGAAMSTAPSTPGPSTLLGAVQAEMAGAPLPAGVIATDPTFSVHDCHSALREIETLRELALSALAADPTLRPHDITLYLTSLDAYLPAVDAVFGVPQTGVPMLPYTVAGLSFRQNAPAVMAFMRLLEECDGRASLKAIGALLALPAIARAAALTEDDASAAIDLLTKAGVIWGSDAEDRAQRASVPIIAAGTWAHGLDRLVLGVATGPADAAVGDLLPVAGDMAGSSELIGRLIAWSDALFAQFTELRTERTADQWGAALERTLQRFVQVESADAAHQVATLRETIDDVLADLYRAAPRTPLGISVVRAMLQQAVDGDVGRTGHLRGGIRVCALEPGAVLPARVVLIAGMSDELHPKGSGSLAWDLLRKHPLSEVSEAGPVRSDDPDGRRDALIAFREAIGSARERCHVSWTGTTLTKREKRAPSVALSELVDVARRLTGDRPTVPFLLHEPAHPFSLRLFVADPGAPATPSRSSVWAGAARVIRARGEHRDSSFGDTIIDGVRGPRVLSLDALARSVQDPTRYFCSQVMGIRLTEEDEALPEHEPQGGIVITGQGAADNRFRAVSWRLEAAARRGEHRTVPELADWIRHQPELPFGIEGRDFASSLAALWYARLEEARLMPWRSPERIECRVGGWTIVGRVDQLTDSERVIARLYDVKPHSAIQHWVTHLVMNVAARQGAVLPVVTRLRGNKNGKGGSHAALDWWHLDEVADAESLLLDLCDFHDAAGAAPLPFFRRTAAEWLTARGLVPFLSEYGSADLDDQTGRLRAADAWNGSDRRAGECEEPWHRLCWPDRDLREDDPFYESMGGAAGRILLPMMRSAR